MRAFRNFCLVGTPVMCVFLVLCLFVTVGRRVFFGFCLVLTLPVCAFCFMFDSYASDVHFLCFAFECDVSNCALFNLH